MAGMDAYDAENHLDANDPGVPQSIRALVKKKKIKAGNRAGENFLKSMIPDQDAADLIFGETAPERAVRRLKKARDAALSNTQDFVK